MTSSFIPNNNNQLPSGTILLRIVSNISDPFDFAVDIDQSISETRALLEVEVVGDTLEDNGLIGRAKLIFRGEVLMKEEQTWGSLHPKTGDKLFVTIPNPPSARPTALPGAAAFRNPGTSRRTGNYSAKLSEEERDEDARERRMVSQRQMAMMEPMIDSLANSPQFLEMMRRMSPELEQIIARNPEIARELQNPEVIKQMMRAQHDPYTLHEVSTQLRLQMNHIQNIPGGSNALEKMADQIQRDITAPGNKSAADLTEASEANAMPMQGLESNTRSLPNPWAASSAVGSSSSSSSNINSNNNYQNNYNIASMYPFPYGIMPRGDANAGLRSSTVNQQHQINLFPNFSNNIDNGTLSLANNEREHPTAPPVPNNVDHGTNTHTDDITVDSRDTSAVLETDEPVEFPFHSQLSIIQEMGFEDESAIKVALNKSNGDVDAAVCMLYDVEE